MNLDHMKLPIFNYLQKNGNFICFNQICDINTSLMEGRNKRKLDFVAYLLRVRYFMSLILLSLLLI